MSAKEQYKLGCAFARARLYVARVCQWTQVEFESDVRHWMSNDTNLSKTVVKAVCLYAASIDGDLIPF